MIRVLICDDQEIVRTGLNIILSHSEGLEVVGLAENGAEAVRLTPILQPDVVLMDLKMPLLNGVQATRRIRQDFPSVKVVVLTTYATDDWLLEAIRAGAAGYLLKDSDGELIATAVRGVIDGRSYIDPQIAGQLLNVLSQVPSSPQVRDIALDPLADPLTERELDVLRLMAEGMSNSEIAEALSLAGGTVKNLVSSLLSKFGVSDRTQVVLAALRRGIVHL